MSTVYNFGAGPATLPKAVLQRAQTELLDWSGTGMSVMEVSHRGKEFVAMAAEAESDLRELLAVPDNYKVLFLQGGATTQFAMVPVNLLRGRNQADYVQTGVWGKKAIAEARRLGVEVNVAADSAEQNFTRVPPLSEWQTRADAAYLHITPNETIGGVEFDWLPDTDVPVVADMSSNLLSRPLDVGKFGVIYAGAQKNLGPSGITVVIVRDDLIGHARTDFPSLFDYEFMAKNDSMSNTPPTFAWYVAGLVFKWLQEIGGLAAMGEINARKAAKLYECIDNSGGFYRNPVDVADRSRMNVPFVLADNGLGGAFLAESAAAGLMQLKGHRSVGGMRASIYNAMPEEGVETLIQFMREFQRTRG
jgi:phosphoserine aminotransferase